MYKDFVKKKTSGSALENQKGNCCGRGDDIIGSLFLPLTVLQGSRAGNEDHA
jgi:hypothetical protein